MEKTTIHKTVDKKTIAELKNNNNSFLAFIRSQNDGKILYALEKFGRLNNNDNREILIELLKSKNDNIRYLSVKNLAKFQDMSLLPIFINLAREDKSSIVKRESVSAIGRMRNENAISSLLSFLNENDPKVVIQAIRGLLVFSSREHIRIELLKLGNHKNEIIRELIQKEFLDTSSDNKDKRIQTEFPAKLKNCIVHGDVIEVLKYVPNESIHLTFTSPPYYNARDYSIYQSYDEYLRTLEQVFKEVHRVTKEGRFFILNTSPIIIQRISRAHSSKRYPIPYDVHPLLIKMGWEFIDDIVWVKSEASVKNRNAGFLQHRKPLAYKPNAVTEMIMVYRKKTNKLIDWNIHQYDWDIVKNSRVVGNYESTNVWHIEPTFDKVHSAVFPIELCNRVIKYYSYIGDLVFDPFAGSGTLGRAAMKMNRNYFLTEKEAKYIERMKDEFVRENNLFNMKHQPPTFYEIGDFLKIS